MLNRLLRVLYQSVVICYYQRRRVRDVAWIFGKHTMHDTILSLFIFYQPSTSCGSFLSIPWVPVIIFISQWQRWALLMFINARNSAKRDTRVLTVLRTKNPLHSNEYETGSSPVPLVSFSSIVSRVCLCLFSVACFHNTLSVFEGAVCLYSGWIAPRTYAWDTEFSVC